MKKRTEVSPNHPVARLTLEQQFMVVAGALNRATQQGNTKGIQGLAMMLKGYEEAIAKKNQEAKALAEELGITVTRPQA